MVKNLSSSVEDLDLIPGWVTEIPQAVEPQERLMFPKTRQAQTPQQRPSVAEKIIVK